MEPTLYGPLEFRNREDYMTKTPSEIYAILEGWEWRCNYQIEWTAIWVCALMNASGNLKRAVRPEELLGRPLQIRGGK
jgi:hypothetical protein